MKILWLFLLVPFLGCAHHAKHYEAPQTAVLVEQSGRLHRAVALSRDGAVKVSAGIKDAQARLKTEQDTTAELKRQLAEVERIAPPELMPWIHGLQTETAKLEGEQAADGLALIQLKEEQSKVTAALEEATAAKNEVEQEMPKVIAQGLRLADAANAAEQAWQKDSKELTDIKTHSWLYRIFGAIGAALLVIVLILYFTGKLALAAR